MTISLGPIDGTAMHYTTDDGLTSVPRTLCERGGARLAPRALHVYTSKPDKVTCQDCIEWMHG